MDKITVKTGKAQLSINDSGNEQVTISIKTLNAYSGKYDCSSIVMDNSELLGLFAPSLRLALVCHHTS